MNPNQILCYDEELVQFEECKPIYEKLLDHYPTMEMDCDSYDINCYLDTTEYKILINVSNWYGQPSVVLRDLSPNIKGPKKLFPEDYLTLGCKENLVRLMTEKYTISKNPLSKHYRDVDMFIKQLDMMLECIKEDDEVIYKQFMNDCQVEKTLAKIK